MSLVLGVVVWALIGVIAGLVAPILAGTYRTDRLARMCAFGAMLAAAVGLVAYLVDSIFDDAGPGRAFYSGGSGVLAVIVVVSLFVYEKRRVKSD